MLFVETPSRYVVHRDALLCMFREDPSEAHLFSAVQLRESPPGLIGEQPLSDDHVAFLVQDEPARTPEQNGCEGRREKYEQTSGVTCSRKQAKTWYKKNMIRTWLTPRRTKQTSL